MQTLAFTMQLKKGFEEEYKKRHDQIWPELSQALHEAGIREYYIFLHEESGMLFGIHKYTESNELERLPQMDIMKKWWAYMADIMETRPDHSPVVTPLRKVFFMP